MSENAPIKFFLGANSPQGFVSRFDELDYGSPDWHTFIIKGGPGCGKSSFMKRLAEIFSSRCSGMELIPCASDPDSLDAVILPEWKVSIADGTAPHVIEPKYPALKETLLSFGDFLDPMKIRTYAEEIISSSQTTAKNYTQALSCLTAAKSFVNDSYRIALGCADLEKLSGYASHFACKNFPKIPGKKLSGKEKVRFLSSINSGGITNLYSTVPALCSQVCFICDECGAVSSLFLSALRSHALASGHDVITCCCPLSPHNRIDHLLIPDIGLALMTENRFHDLSAVVPDRRIHAKRFMDNELMRRYKKRLSFNRKAAAQMMDQASSILKENKMLHDRLEKLYLSAMDFSLMDDVVENVVSQIVDLRLARDGGII